MPSPFLHSTLKDDYLKPAADLNWFDIKVIFDPKTEPSPVAEPLKESKDPGIGEMYNDMDSTRYYGKWVPVLLFNNTVIRNDMIERYTLYYDDFVPYLHLILRDDDGWLQTTDVPGMANRITLAMLPHADDKYKAIKLTFYIKNVSYRGEFIICDCELSSMPLEKIKTQQLVFHWPSPGCTADHSTGISDVNNNITDCPLPPNRHPSTYELLHVIGEETGLGFAATDMCSSVRDDKHRILKSEKYKDVIKKHVRFGGTDEDNIFDTWIDLYGYITLVNVPWLMTRKIDFSNMAMHAEIGMGNLNRHIAENSSTPLTHRMISNLKIAVSTNVYVDSYENMVDNNYIIKNGSTNVYFDMNPMGAADGLNNMSTKGVQSVENSVDGVKRNDMYSFEKMEYRGAEMGNAADGNYPEMHQQRIHDKYFSRLRAKRIKVKMGKPNYGLMRGTLIGFSWWEFSIEKKRMIMGQIENLYQENKNEESSIDIDFLYDNVVSNTEPIMNPFVTGIYYIDGMIFEYDARNVEFTQYLILIRKDGEAPDMISNMQNRVSETKYANQ
ncbi:MAG: hypothetical protein J6D03_09600 [Clostridia bacterium]|nr:hypothetical protein [Clostridia bacterium]